MDFYFFLDNGHFDPEITVSNFAPSGEIKNSQDYFVCFALPLSGKWHLHTYKKLIANSSETINWKDLGIERPLIRRVIIFLSKVPLNEVVDVLPETNSFQSTPAWRANLKIKGIGTSVSYQGEYPYNMTKIKNGSIVSFLPLIRNGVGITNYIFYPSFSNEFISKEGIVKFLTSKTKKIITEFKIQSNYVNCLDISELGDSDEQILLVGSGLMGIPIYFSTYQNGERMSLEHAMAPSEYAILGDLEIRRKLMQTMKSFWS
ncbi:hypothetical protein MCESTEH50_00880 [Candidatus Methylopumilus universalis]|uniref:hypothetical protein n=1 Tax=Candidatus Methylopumilus universalis TaxID=2588536 RepID=UPI003BEEB931